MTVATEITIVGAGPYGLSIAAYLRGRGLNFRIIGSPMQSWLTKMPKDMLLKSAGFASTLYDPGRTFTLDKFCKDQGISYHDLDVPISLETFSSYGIAFQKRLVPGLENENLVALNICPEGFELELESGKSFKTRKVILAVGIDNFRYIPEPLANLPAELFSHSAEHHDLQRFRSRDVAVLGGGASAIDIAVLLHEAQANVQLVARQPAIHIGGPWGGRPLWLRIRAPISAIGPGLRSRIYSDAPWLYRYFPDHLRLLTAKTPGPSGGWFMQDRVASVPRLVGHKLQEAKVSGSRVQLRLAADDGTKRDVLVDHVIAATGYRADVDRLPFLRAGILEQLQLIGKTPRLSAQFESTVPGLYFVGPIAATSFGPVMRFAAGAGFTSRTISSHLARTAGSKPSLVTQKANGIARSP
jgi:thioredoxin reductase